jgi:sulfoxide reductase catalytic subunit YedY
MPIRQRRDWELKEL